MIASTNPSHDPDLSSALDALPDGLIHLHGDGRVGVFNRVAGVISGIDPQRVQGMSFAALCREGNLNWTVLQEMIEGGRNGNVILRCDPVGAVLASLRRIDPADAAGGYLLQLRDLTVLDHVRRQAEGRRQFAPLAPAADHRMRPDGALDRILSRGERAFLQGARVIITGESGVGKTEVARHLHHFVASATDPFIVVNCAAIPEGLFESELFGYERGAFTGAAQEGKKGLIEAAEGGTLFLDEVGEIPLPLQAKLLSYLEDGVVTRIGGTRPRPANVRVISATNRDLLEMAERREFRLDLYYRLAVVQLPILPLREMPELIDHLIDRFLSMINNRRTMPMRLSEHMRARLRGYRYPGNIRELWNLMQQISVLGEQDDELPEALRAMPSDALLACPDATGGYLSLSGRPLRDAVSEFELRVIQEAIRIHGSKRKAAVALGVDIGTISRKTKKLNRGDEE